MQQTRELRSLPHENLHLVQANIASSREKNTLRGMHYQVAPHEETKIVRCIRGAIYDVIIDLRPNSPTFREWVAVELSQDNHKMLVVPEEFAHGYLTLTDDSEVFYLVNQFYSPESERGLCWNDPAFNIFWPENENLIISEKDKKWPPFLYESSSN